jgi:hypothetical protein
MRKSIECISHIGHLRSQENTGALQRTNWMELAELLNPPNEAHGMNTVTDKDIFDAVMEAKKEQEEARRDDIGEEDSREDSEELTPTHAEVIHATLVLARATKDKKDPFLHKFESNPASFRWWTPTANIKNMQN